MTECSHYGVAILNLVQWEKPAIDQRLAIERFDLDRNDHSPTTKAFFVSALAFASGHGSSLTRLPNERIIPQVRLDCYPVRYPQEKIAAVLVLKRAKIGH